MKRDKSLEEAAAKILRGDLQEVKTPSKSELEDGETDTAHGGMQHFSTIDGKQWVWNYALKSKSKSLSSQPGKWEYTNKKDQATAIAVSTWGGKKLKVAKMIEEDINLEEGFKTFLTKVIKLGVKIIKSETGRYVIKSAIKALAMKVASDVSKKEVSLEITDVPRDRLNIIKSAAKNNGVKMTQDGETVHILGKEDIVYDFIDDVKDDLSLEETTESQEDTDLTESTSVVTQLQDIIDQKSFKAVKTSDGKQTKVDMTTANAMLTVYKALNKQNQKRVDELMTKDKMGLLKFVDFAWNNVKSK